MLALTPLCRSWLRWLQVSLSLLCFGPYLYPLFPNKHKEVHPNKHQTRQSHALSCSNSLTAVKSVEQPGGLWLGQLIVKSTPQRVTGKSDTSTHHQWFIVCNWRKDNHDLVFTVWPLTCVHTSEYTGSKYTQVCIFTPFSFAKTDQNIKMLFETFKNFSALKQENKKYVI